MRKLNEFRQIIFSAELVSKPMETYRTFLRSAQSFAEFGSAEKFEQETGLTLAEALEACKIFNSRRSDGEIASGTKLEFEKE